MPAPFLDLTQYPEIDWRKPLPVRNFDGIDQGFACRICIAVNGLKGSQLAELPKTIEDFEQHMKTEHPEPSQ